MRTNSKTKQLVQFVAKITLLAMCFALVFAVVMAVSPLESTTDDAGIVYADAPVHGDDHKEQIPVNGKTTVYNAKPMFASSGGLKATDFAYPYGGTTVGTKRTWSAGDDLSTVKATSDNQQVMVPGGDGNLYTFINQADGLWNWGVNSSWHNAQACYGVLNINTGSFITSLLERPDVTVSVFYSATVRINNNVKSVGWAAARSDINGHTADQCKEAWDSGSNIKWGAEFDTSGTNNAEITIVSNTVTLTKDEPYFSIFLRHDWNWYAIANQDFWLYVKGFQFTYIIEMDNAINDSSNAMKDVKIYDNSAPVVANEFLAGKSGLPADSFSPYLTSATASGWPIYYDSIQSALVNKTDSVVNGEGKLSSYTTGTKTSTITYLDTANYYNETMGFSYEAMLQLYAMGGASEVANAAKYMYIGGYNISGVSINGSDASVNFGTGDARYIAGIRSVTIGDRYQDIGETRNGAYFEMWNISIGTETSAKDVYVDGVKVGTAKVKRDNRGRVTVTTTISSNASINTRVEDFGGLYLNKVITYSGIDKKAPSVGTSASNGTFGGIRPDETAYFNNTNRDDLSWYRRTTLSVGSEVEIFEEDNSDFTPYIWFYRVTRNATAFSRMDGVDMSAYEPTSLDKLRSLGMQPIAYGSFNSFEYNFETGMAKQYGWQGGDFAAGNPNGMGAAKGTGYYRFDFFVFDMAGNYGGYQSFYVKVDYTDPDHTISMYFVDDTTASFVNITPANNATKWATGATTLEIQMGAINRSGYTLLLEDEKDTAYMFVIDKGGVLLRYGTQGNMTEATSNKATIEIASRMHSMDVQLTVKKVLNGTIPASFTFTFDDSASVFAFVGSITLYAGEYNTINDLQNDDMSLGLNLTDWHILNVLIDRQSPNKPNLSGVDDEGAFVEDTITSIPALRDWYVKGYSFDADLTFSDLVLSNSDYKGDIKIQVAMKSVTSLAELTALRNLHIENIYKAITSDNSALYFEKLTTFTGNDLDGDQTGITLDLVKSVNAGLRVFYVWAVDQAGNCSELSTYYMFVDGNRYTIRSTVLANALLGDSASVVQTDDEETATTTFVRGQQVVVSISLDEGYVPFKFTRVSSDADDLVLLENYLPQNAWTVANADFASYISTTGYDTVKYLHDDPNNLGKLSNVTTLEFAHRQVISYTVTNRQVSYTSQALVVPIVLNNDSARNAFSFVYVDSLDNLLYVKNDGRAVPTPTTSVSSALKVDGQPVPFVPVAVGEYRVRVFIDKNNPTFVTSDYQQDDSGKQLFEAINIEILKGNAVITAVATASEYGQPIVLEYTLDGVVEEKLASENINFTLGLKIDGYQAGQIYDAGTYQIVAIGLNNDDSPNYNVSFVSASHIITKKNIEIMTWSATKAYGDADPEFLFAVNKAQFDSDEAMLNVFGGGYTRREDGEFGGQDYYLFAAGNRIARAQGTVVGEYEYIADGSLFDINSNYQIFIQNNQYFTIVQRVVTLEVGGQSTVLPFGSTVDTLELALNYTLSAQDSALASEIAELVEGKLSISSDYTLGSDEDYDAVYLYKILLELAANDNISVQLGADNDYIVYIAKALSVLVNLKPNVKIEFLYGIVWDDEATIRFDADKFDVSADAPQFADIIWSASIASGNGSTPNVGGHLVTISNAKLVDEDGIEIAAQVFVSTFSITINPQIITVSPTLLTNVKTYGEHDSVYGIGFDIATVAGLPFANGDTFAGLEYADLKGAISGSFARARYTVDGSFRSYGSTFDDATNDQGRIINAALGEGEYYGFVVDVAFASANHNFVVQAVFNPDVRFIINPKEVQLNTASFVGVSKTFDGTTAVYYSDVAYDLTSALVRKEDRLSLSYIAQYKAVGVDDNDEGSPSVTTPTSILFESLALVGDSACNYVLTVVNNNSPSAQVNGSTSVDVVDIDASTTIRIFYIDNGDVADDKKEMIFIYFGEIGLRKSDISITKQYDNNRRLTIDCINIANIADGHINTTLLVQALATGNAYIIEEESSSYSDVRVGNNYVISSLSIFFPIANADEIFINELGSNNELTVTHQEIDGVEGIKISVANLGASITQRVLDIGSFESGSIVAVDRDYNATGYVDMAFTFATDALADGETPAMVNLVLMAEIIDGNYNAGTHLVKIADLGNSLDGIHTFVGNSNYALNVTSLNNVLQGSLTVYVDRAKLMPNVEFVTKEYDGTTNVPTISNGSLDLTTLHYATNLMSELANFSISGSVQYKLSSNGVENANVTYDIENDSYLHNVLVRGLTIVENGGNNYLSNYQIYGMRYADGNYNTVGSIVSGAEIADYEIIGATTVLRKTLAVISNNITIKDKVYDGTVDAIITISLPDDAVVAEHVEWLQILADGKFARKQVGNNINVTVSNVRLSAVTQEGEEIFYNYRLAPFKGKLTGNIIPRPIVLGADLGEKEYNGQAIISKGSISYSFDGMLESELSYYTIQTTKSAYYKDADVEVERDPYDNHVIYRDGNGTVLTYVNGLFIEYKGAYESSVDAVYGNTIYVTSDNEQVFKIDNKVYRHYTGEYTQSGGHYYTLDNTALLFVDGHYYDSEGVHAKEKFATVLNKQGTIYDPVLANSKENYINYVLTQKSTVKTTNDYVAYCDKSGNMHYYELANNADDVAYYCYLLPSTTKYVSVSDADSIEAARSANAIVGYYGAYDNGVYLVREDWVAPAGTNVHSLPNATIYFNADGKILQRSAYIKADGIKKTDRATAFVKEYDATVKFFGTMADDAMSPGDFYFEENSISNVISGDEVYLEDVFAEFERADTGSTYVVFTVSGIIGKDAYKYATGAVTTQTRIHATITKRYIDAELHDGEMIYGTNPTNAGGEITYSVSGYPLIWDESENAFFMNFKQYLVVLGFINSVDEEPSEEDAKYLKRAIARCYDLIDGEFVLLAEEEVGEYVRLAGSFSLPKPTAMFASSKPVVGEIAQSYTITKGDATNYVFNPVYTQGASSKLVVIKKNMYISTDGIDKTQVYGASAPVVNLNYYDENGNSSIVSGETWMSIFKVGGVDLRPQAQLAIYNTTSGTYQLVDKYAKLNSDLAADEYYVYVLTAPNGVDYDEIVHNYNIIFGTLTHVPVLDDNGFAVLDDSGKALITPVFTYAGTSLQAQTTQLTITLPTLSGVGVNGAQFNYVYTRGVDRARSTVTGLESDDIVKLLVENGNGFDEVAVVNAGSYTGYIKVMRPVKIDDGDTNGYYISWVNSELTTINISKADINAKALNVVKEYTGATQRFELSGANNSYFYDDVSIPESFVIVKIEKYSNGEWIEAELLDAGEYRVTVTLSAAFDEAYPNYTYRPAQATYTITKAVVNVSIKQDGYDYKSATQEIVNGRKATILRGVYDSEREYDIVYTITNEATLTSAVRLSLSQTKVEFAKEITQPGKYPFDIVLNDSTKNANNYNFVGGAGVLELSATHIASATADVFVEDGVVANRLVARQISEDNHLASDTAFIEAVKQYMPTISIQGGLKDVAKVAYIYRIGLYCDDTLVALGPDQEAVVTINLPQDIASMNNIAVYMVTQEGGLRKLTDYTLVDGKMQYTTDYVGSLVFVDITPQGLPTWALYLLAGCGIFLAAVVLIAFVAFVIRKSRLRKLM